MKQDPRTVVVFGSAGPAEGSEAYAAAYALGVALAAAGFRVANGGYGGIMAASAAGARQAGGRTLGVTCRAFGRSGPNAWLDEVVETATLQERIDRLIGLGDGYVFCPGGTGTLLELALVWELMNKKFLSPRPVVALGDFWRPVVSLIMDAGQAKRCPVQFVDDAPAAAAWLQEQVKPGRVIA